MWISGIKGKRASQKNKSLPEWICISGKKSDTEFLAPSFILSSNTSFWRFHVNPFVVIKAEGEGIRETISPI